MINDVNRGPCRLLKCSRSVPFQFNGACACTKQGSAKIFLFPSSSTIGIQKRGQMIREKNSAKFPLSSHLSVFEMVQNAHGMGLGCEVRDGDWPSLQSAYENLANKKGEGNFIYKLSPASHCHCHCHCPSTNIVKFLIIQTYLIK
jgi:hypothetical protein